MPPLLLDILCFKDREHVAAMCYDVQNSAYVDRGYIVVHPSVYTHSNSSIPSVSAAHTICCGVCCLQWNFKCPAFINSV